MASFADLVKAQRQSGKGVISSLSSAYNQQQMEKFDVRNKLFKDSGLMTALFPNLKGYKAQPVGKNGSLSPSPIMQGVSTSPSLTKAVARDLRISARNSMVLPSIARNMATMVTIWGGKAAKVPKGYTESPSAKGGKKGGDASSGGIGGALGGLASGIGGALGGIGSIFGSMVSGVGSVIGSILGGVGSLLGGAASGIMGIFGSALGGMGIWGVLIAGIAGFAIYSIFKSVDFSSLGKGIGGAMESIQSALSGLFNEVDGMSGGQFGEFLKWTKNMLKGAIDRIGAGIQTALELFSELGTAVLLDLKGFFTNFFQENKGKIFALMAIGLMGPQALLTLPGAAIATIAGLVGAATGEVDLDTLQKQRSAKQKELEDFKKTGQMNIQGDETDIPSKAEYEKKLQNQIGSLDTQIKEKQDRTSHVKQYTSGFSIESVNEKYQQKFAERSGTSPTAAGAPTPGGPLTGANLLDVIAGGESGRLGYEAANKGNTKSGFSYPGLSKLTIGQVMDLQANKELFAAGRYQIIPKTLAMLVKAGVAKREDQFSPVIQDKLAMELVNRRLKDAGSDPIKQQFELSKEFASIENPYTGTSYYDGTGGNKASISSNQMQLALRGGQPNNSSANSPQLASNTPQAPTNTKSSAGDTMAAFAGDQVRALDKLMGGKLMQGSTDLADMLRDVTMEAYKEFMNNPAIDNSTTVNNNNTSGGSTPVASTYNPDILNALMSGRVWERGAH